MKIYRIDTLVSDCCYESAQHTQRHYPTSMIWPVKTEKFAREKLYCVTIRREFSHDLQLSDKQVAKMLPAWAKKCMASSPTIGHKVTAFYALNNKVVTDCSGLVVGSDEYYDWLETQPDPFRSTRNYRQSLGELIA